MNTFKMTVVMLAALVSACSSPSKIESPPSTIVAGVPVWVTAGTSLLRDKDSRLFQGVGYAPTMNDLSRQKSVADDHARAEVSQLLSLYLEEILKSFLADTKNRGGSVATEVISTQIKSISNIPGTKTGGGWRDPKSGIIYSRAELNLRQVKRTLAGVTDMNEELRRYIETQADSIFDQVVKRK